MLVLTPMGFLWNNLWSVSRYVMGPLSGRWRQGGNDQQCLAAPIWKYRSGFGDHRFNFFIDLLPNYTFHTNLTNVVHWAVAYRAVAHLIRLNLGKSWEKYAKSFDAGLTRLLTQLNNTSSVVNKACNSRIYTDKNVLSIIKFFYQHIMCKWINTYCVNQVLRVAEIVAEKTLRYASS